MTGCVEPLEVLSFITSPGVHRDAVMEMDLLSIEQGLATPQTLPPLGGGDSIERAAFGHALTPHLAAPAVPIRLQGGIVRARAAFYLHVADNGDGRHPCESEADGLPTSIATVRIERGAVLPDFEVSAIGPPLRFLGVPAFRPAPQRPPDVVVHCLEGLFTDHMAVVHGPASEDRVQMANDAFCGDGLRGFQPGPDLLKECLHLLFLGRDQEFLPPHLPMEPEEIKALGPLYKAGLLRMERQTPFLQKGGDHGARLLNGGQALCHHEDVVGIPGDPVAFPQSCGQSIKGDIRQQWADHAALGRPFRRVVQRAVFPVPGLQPLFDQLPPWQRANAVQDDVVAEVVKGALDIGVQDVVVVAYSTSY